MNSMLLFIDSTFLRLKSDAGMDETVKEENSFISFILVLLLRCSCQWQKKIEYISFSKGLSKAVLCQRRRETVHQ